MYYMVDPITGKTVVVEVETGLVIRYEQPNRRYN